MIVENILENSHKNFVKVCGETKLIEIAKLLTSGTDIVVVCDDHGVLHGVVTKTDVVKRISVCAGETCLCPASAVMTQNVVLCRMSDRLQEVSELMRGKHLKNIPVVDVENKPIGVLTARAILRAILSDVEYEEALLVDYVKGIGYR